MIKNVLSSIGGVEVYAIIALVMFVLVFTGAIVVAFVMKRGTAAERCRMPLEDSILGDKS
jgi:hypothetical protein